MTTITKLQRNYKALKFCPVCGKKLGKDLTSGRKACLKHGDFDCIGQKVVWEIGRYEREVDEPNNPPAYPPTGTRGHSA